MKIHFSFKNNIRIFAYIVLLFFGTMTSSESNDHRAAISKAADNIEQKVIDWRHDIRTADLIAKYLKSLGIEVQTKVGVTGVMGILKGDQLAHVVALRADMNVLPVEEKSNLPFAFKVKPTIEEKKIS